MGLFDNIFLDEDAATATTAVAEKIEETTTDGTTPEIAIAPETATTGDSFDSLMGAEAAPQGEDITIPSPESTPTEELATTADITATAPDLGFDIGGDIDFGANPESTPIETLETPVAVTETSTPTEPVSFTVNGITYNADGTEVSPITENTPDNGSIAMIQGSTAASGINIIDTITETNPEEVQSSTDTVENAETAEGNIPEVTMNEEAANTENISLMNMFSDDETVTASTVPETDPAAITTNIETPTPEIMEPLVALDMIPETPIAIESETKVEEPPQVTLEEDTTTPTPEITKIDSLVESIHDTPHDITAIISGFIRELNEREMEISRIVMKRHELAKQRTRIDEDYKTRTLALNMEDEFLKNKAERERSEQDKLQHVIKNFQKQIAASE